MGVFEGVLIGCISGCVTGSFCGVCSCTWGQTISMTRARSNRGYILGRPVPRGVAVPGDRPSA